METYCTLDSLHDDAPPLIFTVFALFFLLLAFLLYIQRKCLCFFKQEQYFKYVLDKNINILYNKYHNRWNKSFTTTGHRYFDGENHLRHA